MGLFYGDKGSKARAVGSIRRRRRTRGRRRCFEQGKKGGGVAEGVAKRLEALKKLMPSSSSSPNGTNNVVDEVTRADRLFEEAADYILLLRTQVDFLQKLVDFYGSGEATTASPLVS